MDKTVSLDSTTVQFNKTPTQPGVTAFFCSPIQFHNVFLQNTDPLMRDSVLLRLAKSYVTASSWQSHGAIRQKQTRSCAISKSPTMVLRILWSFEVRFRIKAIPLIASTCQTRPWFAYATNLVLPTSLLSNRSKQTLHRDFANSVNAFVKPSLHLTLEYSVAGILLCLYILVRDSKDFHVIPFSWGLDSVVESSKLLNQKYLFIASRKVR